jgi:hypothetical protein
MTKQMPTKLEEAKTTESTTERKESNKTGNPKYFSCSTERRDPRRKSEITLYATRR